MTGCQITAWKPALVKPFLALNELDKECLMQSLYDPQDILKILQSPEQARPASIFRLFKNLVLEPLDEFRKHLMQGMKGWLFAEIFYPSKTGWE
jgi:hypothetical protein